MAAKTKFQKLKLNLDWIRNLETITGVKRFRLNAKETEIMISSEEVGKASKEGKIPCVVCRNISGSSLILYPVLQVMGS